MAYQTFKAHGVIISIGATTDVPGYTKTVLESFLPSDEELKAWNEKKTNKWIKSNNKRMEAICKFLNESYHE